MQADLTAKQSDYLTYLEKEIASTGRAPSLSQAASDFSVSRSAVVQYLKALEEKGYLKREGRYSRTIHLLNRTREVHALQRWREIPIIGRCAAGLPMYAQQEWDGTLVVDAGLYRGPNLFALKVKGDSMIGAGILDGDLVICEPRQYALDKEIVVALINGEEATLKRFFLKKDGVELRPENSDFSPMFYGFDEIMIQGKVIGLERGPEQAANL
jgi:repressor LexA